MIKTEKQNFAGIIKRINKNVIVSFLAILIFFIVTVTTVFVNYKNNERKFISQKLQATFLTFTSKISQKLLAITMLDDFRDCLHSGKISREHNYNSLLIKMLTLDLNVLAGMDIFDSAGINLFSYGIVTDDVVTLDLCYLNRRILNFNVGTCSYSWRLYFKHDVMIEELKRINPELVDCKNCDNEIVRDKYFGDFPVAQLTNMRVNLTIQKDPSMVLWEMLFFITCALLVLVIWNINRIKRVFRKYLSDPVVEITSKIKGNERLPRVAVAELAYLTEQIEQWQEQVIELEKIKSQEEAKEEKVKLMQSVGASIAHELRTPLRSIIAGVVGIEKYLPALIAGYDLAANANLIDKVIRPQQLELLHNVLSNLKTEGASANIIIDMFLMKIRGSVTEISGIKMLSIVACVNEALQRYVFQGSEKELIVCDLDHDFQFAGDKLLVVHILFNLLKNALYYIASAQKGQIYIYFKKSESENMLYFKDTGKGIAKEILPHIFEGFYSKTEGGVGIGLSFCKMAMAWMGGDITCRSVEGEYTEFVLHFPIPKV